MMLLLMLVAGRVVLTRKVIGITVRVDNVGLIFFCFIMLK